eukprot:snap_masked-scaffold474_size162001-processed-gene-0.12 protein:Tk10282 transcript:snap_masked-scaffold474_size162001-processed-gene-0.12-mRNA-1 annotation:"conserved hypothetical protein"
MAETGEGFEAFYTELKATEKRDSVLTSDQQIDRLLRPGSTYRNLNPFEVLQLDPGTAPEEVRKKYRRLSILVHPDKNPKNVERAQAAFDAVKKAYEMLDDVKTRAQCMEIVEEAEGRTRLTVEEKRKQRKKQGLSAAVEEDDPAKLKQAVHVLIMKLFADLERKRRTQEQKISDQAAKKRADELATEERRNMEKEFHKNWEESRQGRVNSWQTFKAGSSSGPSAGPPAEPIRAPPPTSGPAKKKVKKKKFSPLGFRPPKTKPESR